MTLETTDATETAETTEAADATNHPIYDSVSDYVVDHHAPSGRVLALDVGSKWIGIALSDTRTVIASPHSTYERRSFQKDHAHIQKLLNDHGVTLVIVGLPLNLDGSLSTQGESIYRYILNLYEKMTPFSVPLLFWDERFSTNAVNRAMLDHDMTRKRRGDRIDKLAATYMLQGVLDYFAHRARS